MQEDSQVQNASDSPASGSFPALYLPHGGGPCFFMDWGSAASDNPWASLGDWLKGVSGLLPSKPKALLVISAHWEQRVPTLITAPESSLLYDYSGFPPHTYQLKWSAPGAPALAKRARALLEERGFEVAEDAKRGLDHGVFIPLKLTYPEADIPTLQLSLVKGLDPETHLSLGRALAPLREEGVLIIGSGMSYHNMRGFMRQEALPISQAFDEWLGRTVTLEQQARDRGLASWASAPGARQCHPREEHLIPLLVVAGAAGADLGQVPFSEVVAGVQISAVRFG